MDKSSKTVDLDDELVGHDDDDDGDDAATSEFECCGRRESPWDVASDGKAVVVTRSTDIQKSKKGFYTGSDWIRKSMALSQDGHAHVVKASPSSCVLPTSPSFLNEGLRLIGHVFPAPDLPT